MRLFPRPQVVELFQSSNPNYKLGFLLKEKAGLIENVNKNIDSLKQTY